MNQNTFCSKCHRIPSQCCCGSVKDLTDEEIVKLYEETSFFGVLDPVKFARAILRKASEK